MQQLHELSPSEWELMDVIWQLPAPITVREVLEKAYPAGEKAYTTVQTFMNILVKKGYLSSEKSTHANHYAVLVTRESVLAGSMTGTAKRMFSGSFGSMASFLVNTAPLTEKEIDELQQILAQKKRGKS